MSTDMIEEDEVNSTKCKSIRKKRNKIVEILTKSKIRNLSNFRFRDLFNFKKIQSAIAIKKPNFLTIDTKIIFIKLKQAFIYLLIF